MGDNRLVVHICGPQRLAAEVIGLYESEHEMEMRCAKCGARLQPGDQKDHFWPYFNVTSPQFFGFTKAQIVLGQVSSERIICAKQTT